MEFYDYKALVTRVVDGDTIDAKVFLGFNAYMEIRFRLTGFDAPETYRPKSDDEKAAGMLATEALIRMIGDKEVIIRSNKFGKYRWLGTIFLEGDDASVNQMMVDMGHIKKDIY